MGRASRRKQAINATKEGRPSAERSFMPAAPAARLIPGLGVADGAGYELALVHDLAAGHRAQAAALRSAVVEALEAGASWNQIGAALGVSRQSAHRMYRGSPPEAATDSELF